MGVIAKRTTARLMAPLEVRVGGWYERLADSGLPDRQDLLAAACYQAVLGVDLSRATSSTSYSALTTMRSLLQVRSYPKGALIGCGAASPSGAFVCDWQIAMRLTDKGDATLTVGDARTLKGELVNSELFVEVREAVCSALADGPRIEIVEGAPDVSPLLRSSVLRQKSRLNSDESPFAGDWHIPPPSEFSTRTLYLPDGGARALADAASACTIPGAVGEGSCLWRLDLSGGRQAHKASLSIVSGRAGDAVELELPDLAGSSVGAQRTFRAVVSTLVWLAERTAAENPETGRALTEYVKSCLDAWQRPDRRDLYQPVWDADTPAGVVGTDVPLPVAVVFDAPGSSLFDFLRFAQSWLLARQRSPRREEGRGKDLWYAARRPVMHKTPDGKLLARLRYVKSPVTSPEVLANGPERDGQTVFWECSAGTFESAGRQKGFLAVRGLSQTDGQIGYGAELLALFQAFCWELQAAQPGKALSTIRLGGARKSIER